MVVMCGACDAKHARLVESVFKVQIFQKDIIFE